MYLAGKGKKKKKKSKGISALSFKKQAHYFFNKFE